METNTVILSVQDYNELRDFKNKIENDYSYNTWRSTCSFSLHEQWVTNSQAIKELSETNNELMKIINELRSPTKKEPSINEIKKMSVWQFLKWRKK